MQGRKSLWPCVSFSGGKMEGSERWMTFSRSQTTGPFLDRKHLTLPHRVDVKINWEYTRMYFFLTAKHQTVKRHCFCPFKKKKEKENPHCCYHSGPETERALSRGDVSHCAASELIASFPERMHTAYAESSGFLEDILWLAGGGSWGKREMGSEVGEDWLVNTRNKHGLTCPELIPGRAQSKCDQGLKEGQTSSVSFETNPYEVIFLGILIWREVHSYLFFFPDCISALSVPASQPGHSSLLSIL